MTRQRLSENLQGLLAWLVIWAVILIGSAIQYG